MKNGLLLITILILSATTAAFGEEVLSRRLSVEFRGTPLKQALDEVAKLADFEWSYNADMLDADRRVTLVASDWTVREVLREMLGENFGYKSNGKYLILKKQRPPKSELSGVIRDPKTGERLAHVTVYDRKTLRATTTDSSGYYSLKVKDKAEIVVARLGYRDTLLQVTSISPRYQKIALSQIPVPPADSSSAQKFRKSLQQTASELDRFFAATMDKWHDLNVPDTLQRRFQISFLPYLGTNHVLSGKVENNLSVNVLAGQSAGVRGVEVAGLGNFTKKLVRGVQAAGLFNLNHGNCTGVQAAGLFNQTADTLTGVQAAGLVNVARYSPTLFVQAAGLINIVRKNDVLEGDTTIAPKGVQLAGLINKTDALEGLQASGLVNGAKDIQGIQVAGLVNHARRMRGIQIGLINSARELHGLQIGLINRAGKRWLPVVNWGR